MLDGVDVCESKVLIIPDDTGLAMVRCGGKEKGIEAVLRFGTVRTTSDGAGGCMNPFGNGRALRSASMLAFPWLVGELPDSVDAGESGRGPWWLPRARAPGWVLRGMAASCCMDWVCRSFAPIRR